MFSVQLLLSPIPLLVLLCFLINSPNYLHNTTGKLDLYVPDQILPLSSLRLLRMRTRASPGYFAYFPHTPFDPPLTSPVEVTFYQFFSKTEHPIH